MFEKLKAFLKSEVADPAVRRAVGVVAAALIMKYFLLDQEHSDTIVTGFFSAMSYFLSTSPGKGQS